MAFVTKPLYPNVPNVIGVPPLKRRPGNSIATIALLATDAVLIYSLFLPARWGLFKGLAPIIASDSVVGLDYSVDATVSNAQQERGAFLSYNKVSNPFRGRVGFVCGGSEGRRTAFLASVQAAQNSLELFTLVMPEYSYKGVSVIHHNFRRSQRSGVSLLMIEVWVEEVRLLPDKVVVGNKAKTPSGATPLDIGQVQTAPLTPVTATPLPAPT